MATFPSSNSVSDSLEKCRQAFSRIVESQLPIEEEEDYLEKASKFVEEEPMDDDDAVFVDSNKQEDDNLATISKAISDAVDTYAANGIAVKTTDRFETEDDDGFHRYCFEFESSADVDTITRFASDVEKMLGNGFEIVSMEEVSSEAENTSKVLISIAFTGEQVSESAGFKPFKQERKRQKKPIQIKKSAQFVRNNRLMRRLFRRKYFAKKKLLFGTK